MTDPFRPVPETPPWPDWPELQSASSEVGPAAEDVAPTGGPAGQSPGPTPGARSDPREHPVLADLESAAAELRESKNESAHAISALRMMSDHPILHPAWRSDQGEPLIEFLTRLTKEHDERTKARKLAQSMLPDVQPGLLQGVYDRLRLMERVLYVLVRANGLARGELPSNERAILREFMDGIFGASGWMEDAHGHPLAVGQRVIDLVENGKPAGIVKALRPEFGVVLVLIEGETTARSLRPHEVLGEAPR